jgi:hypothetical protein
MKRKELFGIKLNDLVYIVSENRWDTVVYIDDHICGNFCMANGGRYFKKDLDNEKK